MANSANEKRSSFSRKVREMLLPKPKQLPPHSPPLISKPSRIPTRTKRSHREVDLDDDLDIRHPSSDVAASRRARVRQRVGSTSSIASVATLRPFAKSMDLTRTTSNDSVKTVTCDSAALPSTAKKPRRMPSSLSLGSADAMRAALSRTTSHNQLSDESMDLPLPLRKQGSITFPAKKTSTSSIFPVKVFSKPTLTAKQQGDVSPPKLDARAGKPLARQSSSMMSIVSTTDEAVPHASKDVSFKSKARPLGRASSSMMSIDDTSVCVSRIPVPDGSSRQRKPSLTPSLDEIAAKMALERSLANELEDELNDDSGDFRGMLSDISASASTSTSSNSRSSRASPAVAKSFIAACRENKSLINGWKKGRFDISIEPQKKHVTVWDANYGDVFVWQGTLAVVDTATPPHATRPLYDYPPIKELHLDFSSIEDLPTPTASPPSSPISSSSWRSSAPPLSPSVVPELTVHYQGQVLPRKNVTTHFDDKHGICLEQAWEWGHIVPSHPASPPFPRSSSSADAQRRPTYLLRFYVPIPLKLFRRREYHRFHVRSHIVFGDPDVKALSPIIAHAGTVEVAIEHLRKEIHMDGRKPLPTPPCSSP